ncbi:MAG: hypothetical protein M1142_03085 [Patescibacteria group bacterium]|nr:hypothetical protein [Patescibacteria group bacterium]
MIERHLPPLMLGVHKVRVPIIGGGMSIAIAGPEHVAAIANEGGAGTLGGVGREIGRASCRLARSFMERDRLALERLIDVTREISPDGVIGVNILMAARWHKEMIEAAVGPNGKRSKIDFLVVGAGARFVIL